MRVAKLLALVRGVVAVISAQVSVIPVLLDVVGTAGTERGVRLGVRYLLALEPEIGIDREVETVKPTTNDKMSVESVSEDLH